MKLNKLLSAILAAVLISAMAFGFAGCDKKAEVNLGEKSFTFICTDIDGNQQKYEIKTNAATVGEALSEKGLIEGEEGPYGLYVKSVCGITADFDTDSTYWALYIDGEYGMNGVDETDITDGATYELKKQK